MSLILRSREAWTAIVACLILAAFFAILSMTAAMSKCSTIDEPLHATGAFLHVFHHDQRIDPEDPPLWKYVAMLPQSRSSVKIDPQMPEFQQALHETEAETRFSLLTMYFTPENDGEAFIRRTRWAMFPLAIALAGLVATWAWKLGGTRAGVVAMALFSLDPNFIAHAPLVKNDVAAALAFFATAMALWSVGRRLTWWNLPLLGLLCGATLTTKFSGVLIVPMLLLAMIARALLPGPWTLGRTREIRSMARKLVLGGGVCVFCALVGALFIWATYGFRFDPTPQTKVRLNLESQVRQAKANTFFLNHERWASDEELAAMPAPHLVRVVQWIESNRLLPHAYLYGFLYTYQSTLVRSGFLLGQYSDTGWWYYFPLAMLFKTPLATLAAMIVTGAFAVLHRFKPRSGEMPRSAMSDRWTILCIAIPVCVYGLSALMTNLNLGLRHIFPIYAFLFILVGIGAARLARARPRGFLPVAIVLGLGLAVETLAAFPDYIPFFNPIFKAHRLRLLSDSNLDWGQDLPLLARWQQQNAPAGPLYLAYFGAPPPDRAYEIDYVKIPGGYFLRQQIAWPETPGGVIAISATVLQGTHLPPSLREYYRPLRQSRPREILGGSIYLYDVPAPPLPRPTLQSVQREIQLQRRGR